VSRSRSDPRRQIIWIAELTAAANASAKFCDPPVTPSSIGVYILLLRCRTDRK
jgi:hypothetical protein